MKLATYNVNGINGRLDVLLRWLAEAQPDVVCLQELKSPDNKFPRRELERAGYGAIWHGQKSWNGVAELEVPVALVGDFNVMPTDLDVYKPERWRDDALFRPEVKSGYAALVEQGWTDAMRHLHPNERIYTFWKYFRNAFARDAGLRIDHFLLSPALAADLKQARVDKFVRGWDHTSDHAPVWIEL
ncbi:exodeoxyribonuclease III (plasmid) [Rhizobium lusitanum]|uniref:exodeoxyribonuclease III n=1 Tax=Rhizobium lusitanum TaxID=293958 RepID=UPI00160AB2C5|nr:exodeoxyribonuclease III [Rhizobium lusitanum]QND44283.1 exodeoxyribonuclease III [Rhizobium lusitanum]